MTTGADHISSAIAPSRRAAVISTIFLAMLLCEVTAEPTQRPTAKRNAMSNVAHPGTIKITTVATNKIEIVPYDSVPPQQRFVMLNQDGVETHDPDEAKDTIPIVEVRVISLDSTGGSVRPEKAATIRIMEYGPNGRLLRSTTMAGD